MPRDWLEGNAPAQEGGVADKSCVLRIHCAPFQAGDVRLPSAKRGGDPCLAQALALTFSRKLTDQSPRLKRGFEQLGEVWIHRSTAGDELVEVVPSGHTDIIHILRDISIIDDDPARASRRDAPRRA